MEGNLISQETKDVVEEIGNLYEEMEEILVLGLFQEDVLDIEEKEKALSLINKDKENLFQYLHGIKSTIELNEKAIQYVENLKLCLSFCNEAKEEILKTISKLNTNNISLHLSLNKRASFYNLCKDDFYCLDDGIGDDAICQYKENILFNVKGIFIKNKAKTILSWNSLITPYIDLYGIVDCIKMHNEISTKPPIVLDLRDYNKINDGVYSFLPEYTNFMEYAITSLTNTSIKTNKLSIIFNLDYIRTRNLEHAFKMEIAKELLKYLVNNNCIGVNNTRELKPYSLKKDFDFDKYLNKQLNGIFPTKLGKCYKALLKEEELCEGDYNDWLHGKIKDIYDNGLTKDFNFKKNIFIL